MRLWMILVLVLLAGCVSTEGEERLATPTSTQSAATVTAGQILQDEAGKYFIPDRGDGCAYFETGRTPAIAYPAAKGGELPAEVMLWADGCPYGISYEPSTGKVGWVAP